MLGIGWKDGVATIVDRRLVHKSSEPDMGEFAGQGVEAFEFIADVEAKRSFPSSRQGTLQRDHLQGARHRTAGEGQVPRQGPEGQV